MEKLGRPCGKAKCGPCARCGRTGFSFFHVGLLQNDKVKDWFKKNARLTDTDCICKACKVSVSKKQRNPKYTPEKSRKRKRTLCVLSKFSKCDLPSSHNMECSQEDLNSCFSVDFTLSEINNFPLCKQHYNILWKYRFASKCSGCRVTIRSTSKKYLCSSLDMGLSVARDILKSVHGDSTLMLDGYLCYACYLLVSGNVSAVISLHDMKTSFQNNLSSEITEENDVIDHCLFKVYIHIIDSALEHRAVILSDLYDFYKNTVQSCICVQKDLDIDFDFVHELLGGF